MNKKIYTVKGLVTAENGDEILTILAKVLPEATDAEYDLEGSKLIFSMSFKTVSQNDAEQKLAGALAVSGYELILPEGVDRFAYVGKPVKQKMIPLQVAISLIAAFMALTMLFTFAACDLFSVGSQNGGIVNGGSATDIGSVTDAEDTAPTINIVIENDDIPDYIKELIKLDAIFRQNSYDGIDEEAMGENILKAYVAATGDLYAEYMTPEEFESYMSESAAEFVGVGVSIVNTTIEINGYNYKVMQVISVFANSPALENDVRVGDCIMYVGGGNERLMVDQLGYTEALDRMLGEEGTMAEFTVFRPDKNESIGYKEIEFSIARRKVVTESVNFRISETNSKVGIINVTGFDQKTAIQFSNAVDTLKAQGCEYFVFDMRNNPGGSLYSIQAVLSYFLNKGDLIVSTEYADGYKDEYYVQAVNYGSMYEGYNVYSSDIGKYKDLNAIVLTNENTASAAELFTATMRDYGIAKIVGTTTYGKGCMQNIIDLDRYYGMEGALRVTTAMYFSKSHYVYHDIGIVPDYEVELSEEAKEYNFFLLPEELDDQLQKAIEELTK